MRIWRHVHYDPKKMSFPFSWLKSSDHNCWQGCGASGIPTCCWYECKLQNPFNKTWTVCGKVKINSPNDPPFQLLSKYLTGSLTGTGRHSQECSCRTGDSPTPISNRSEKPTTRIPELLYKQRKHIINNVDEPSKTQCQAKQHRWEHIPVWFSSYRIRSRKIKLFSDM